MKPGEERIYNPAFDDKLDIVLWDVFPIIDSEKITVTFRVETFGLVTRDLVDV